MDSARSRWGRTLLLSGAAAATAGLFYLGTGLHPMPWLTWLAPLPALLIAPRISLPAATAVAFTGYLVGLAGYGRYLLADLEIPGPAVIGILTGVSMIFTVVVLLFRGLLRRGWALTAAVVAPAAWTSAEFLMGRLGPYGANWSLANAQADLLPILQTASITGVYGVSFLIFGTAAAIAVVAAPRIDDQRRVVTLLVAVAVLAVALGFGAIRLAQSPSTPTVRVALVAAHGAGNVPEVGTMEARSRMAAGLSWLRDHETQQGMIIVFPEKDFAVDQNTLPAVITAFGAVAHRKQATIVLGLEHHTGSDIFNTALVFTPDGAEPLVYHKQRPVVGAEDEVTPGTGDLLVSTPSGVLGIAICTDLGHPEIGRHYAQAGARLLLVPALDFQVDDWSQSRVQLLRGVESGFSTVRAPDRASSLPPTRMAASPPRHGPTTTARRPSA